ncbi:CGNR zinc finger domain-containing protein [Saccharomonospora saliphila]|uniref:CGNR zinc finger domain-containing protein n=1 Tax=Saccharomonospora saliphila TaxID=369829 RepID=UPI000374504D|nr:CGNR zinc finger domain-containing protein [Saccharomonospora saliphila]
MVYSREAAPGDLARLETFCNSARLLYGEDSFTTPATASAWLRDAGLARTDIELDEHALARLVELREAIRAHLGGTERERTSEALNSFAERADARPAWTRDGAAHVRTQADAPADELVADLVSVVFTAGLRGTLTRLKPCRAPECRWVFYDRSPQGNSIWCSMRICGARHKMRSYRSRGA